MSIVARNPYEGIGRFDQLQFTYPLRVFEWRSLKTTRKYAPTYAPERIQQRHPHVPVLIF